MSCAQQAADRTLSVGLRHSPVQLLPCSPVRSPTSSRNVYP